MIKGTVWEPLVWWMFSGIAVTGVFAGIYLAMQQNYRQTLNDPQIQMAEDGASALASGATLDQIVPTNSIRSIDLETSLAPWIAVYDESGVPLTSSGVLDEALPKPPIGVFDAVKNETPHIAVHHLTAGIAVSEQRISWQPNPDVRSAIVVVYQRETKQFVVAGRNMRLEEERVAQLGLNLFLAWGFTGMCLLIASFIGWALLKPQK